MSATRAARLHCRNESKHATECGTPGFVPDHGGAIPHPMASGSKGMPGTDERTRQTLDGNLGAKPRMTSCQVRFGIGHIFSSEKQPAPFHHEILAPLDSQHKAGSCLAGLAPRGSREASQFADFT
ncbi:hypothetical protein CBM2615_B80012 [Cupriavidus taiwanensis]|uniref:Uncharacterized protein n=1 Tax=Cupriavidus taiwanensis TaxID=164546 RepID=A0A976G559_9BURK|nr:hypothetical protein CBM2614_B80012 [Cupriavidus taiwanensis]SOZ70947.1 hypothetical protein CBM2615_B80012 [Cupriavidus taiwanensis]SOZ73635.1 hypothetical protein CBM2613_B60012 [Cupriavidus taiwanensis]SPA10391.1 hypothetical protein CBM2625_B70011 [Cupriavidus taiwanensis]